MKFINESSIKNILDNPLFFKGVDEYFKSVYDTEDIFTAIFDFKQGNIGIDRCIDLITKEYTYYRWFLVDYEELMKIVEYVNIRSNNQFLYNHFKYDLFKVNENVVFISDGDIAWLETQLNYCDDGYDRVIEQVEDLVNEINSDELYEKVIDKIWIFL